MPLTHYQTVTSEMPPSVKSDFYHLLKKYDDAHNFIETLYAAMTKGEKPCDYSMAIYYNNYEKEQIIILTELTDIMDGWSWIVEHDANKIKVTHI